MIKTICYISDVKGNITLTNLEDIFIKAKVNNFMNNITGILICKNNNFLQVFEGEQRIVDSTFNKISLDHRHHNIFKIINATTNMRFFEDYNFGFTVVNNKNAEKNLNSYLA